MKIIDGSKRNAHFRLLRRESRPWLDGIRYGTDYRFEEITNIQIQHALAPDRGKAATGAAVGALLFGVIGAAIGAAANTDTKAVKFVTFEFADGHSVTVACDSNSKLGREDIARLTAAKKYISS